MGKTETAMALSELLYGGEEQLITINMSENQESHTVSGLKGSPPGHVGYGEGDVLSKAVRKRWIGERLAMGSVSSVTYCLRAVENG